MADDLTKKTCASGPSFLTSFKARKRVLEKVIDYVTTFIQGMAA